MKKIFSNHKLVIGAVILFSIILVSIFVCPLYSSDNYSEIHPCVKAMMNELSITDCYVKSVGNYSDIAYQLDSPQISSEAIESYITSVKSEYGIQEINEKFVNEQFDCNSVDDFYELVESKLSEQEKVKLILSTRKLIMEQLLEQCSFELNPDIVAQYSLYIVNNYEADAFLYNMSLEEYCSSILGISYDDFFDFCYDEGEYLIKTYLVIGAIALNELEGYTKEDIPTDEQDIYDSYQEIENQVYEIFINTDDDF